MLNRKSAGQWNLDYIYGTFGNQNLLLGHTVDTTNSYLYDLHGNMLKMPHLQSLSWDFKGNIKSVVLDTIGKFIFK
jgi:hypothetical protein